MNNPIQSKQIIILFSFCLVTVLLSCSPPSKIKRPEKPVPWKIEEIDKEFKKRALIFKQGLIEGSAKLFYPDGYKQKIRFLIHWSLENKEPKVRVVGFGPFGITAFEFLAIDGAAYLMVPSKKTTYAALPKELAAHKGALIAARQFMQIINPWSQLEQIKIDPELKGLITGIYEVDGFKSIITFNPVNLMPIQLIGPEIEVNYSDGLYLQDENIVYPKKIYIKLKHRSMTLEIKIKKVQPSPNAFDKKLFDKSRFLQFPVRPWQELFQTKSS